MAQDFSQVLMVARVWVCSQYVYLSAFYLSLTSAFPHSAACGAGTYEMDDTCLPVLPTVTVHSLGCLCVLVLRATTELMGTLQKWNVLVSLVPELLFLKFLLVI